MKRKAGKTLVIVSPGFPAHEADDTCIPPRQIFVKALKQRYPELDIVVLTLQYPFFSKTYQWHGVEVRSLGGVNKGRIYGWFTYIRVWVTLLRLRRERELIGLLSFWLGKCSFIASRFAKQYKLKHYSWILGQDAKPGNKFVARIKPSGASLIALSDFIRAEFERNYAITPQHIIPVGIDTSLFGTNMQDRNVDIVGAGSLIPLKQYDVFLEIIARLKPIFPKLKAVICGDGVERKRLENMITELGLVNNVTMAGRMSNREVIKHMQQSKIFLHTSNYEGFGTVCLEALFAGAKVVSFVKPMNVAIKNWHAGHDKESMVALLQNLLQDTNAVYEPVLPYTATDIAEQVFKLYQ